MVIIIIIMAIEEVRIDFSGTDMRYTEAEFNIFDK